MYCCPFNNIKLYTKYNILFTSSILWSSAVALFRNRSCVTASAGYCSENKQTLIYKQPTHHCGACSPGPHLEGVFHALSNLSSIKTFELYWRRGEGACCGKGKAVRDCLTRLASRNAAVHLQQHGGGTWKGEEPRELSRQRMECRRGRGCRGGRRAFINGW